MGIFEKIFFKTKSKRKGLLTRKARFTIPKKAQPSGLILGRKLYKYWRDREYYRSINKPNPIRKYFNVRTAFSLPRKLAKPEALLMPPLLKKMANTRAKVQNPSRIINYHIAKKRNILLTKIKLKLQKPFSMPDPKQEWELSKKTLCRSRKLRRDDIMRKTAGKGLRIKKAVWSDLSKIKCERKK